MPVPAEYNHLLNLILILPHIIQLCKAVVSSIRFGEVSSTDHKILDRKQFLGIWCHPQLLACHQVLNSLNNEAIPALPAMIECHAILIVKTDYEYHLSHLHIKRCGYTTDISICLGL